jgi:hypothetical protein
LAGKRSSPKRVRLGGASTASSSSGQHSSGTSSDLTTQRRGKHARTASSARTLPVFRPGRLTKEELHALARRIVRGEVFVTNDTKTLESAFGMMLLFMSVKWRLDPKTFGGMYAPFSAEIHGRAFNGCPIFTSVSILHRKDAPLLYDRIAELEARLCKP